MKRKSTKKENGKKEDAYVKFINKTKRMHKQTNAKIMSQCHIQKETKCKKHKIAEI